jgi:ribonuclease T
MSDNKACLSGRFRGYCPVVVDVETGGLDPHKHALLEIAAVTLKFDAQGLLIPDEQIAFNVHPHPDSKVLADALKVNKINLQDANRQATTEAQALRGVFQLVRRTVKAQGCKRAILVGHNAAFDLNVVYAAAQRSGVGRVPFHPFSTLDTVTLGAACYGQTVLAKVLERAQIPFEKAKAHQALYDTIKTAELFCDCVNKIPFQDC